METHDITFAAQEWLILTLGATLPILWAFALSMHFARPYVQRHICRLGARLGADMCWLVYVVIRDGAILTTFALSAIYLFPAVYLSQEIDIPIGAPLAALTLFWALAVKLARDSDSDPAAFRAVSLLLVLSSMLFIVPEVFGVQSAAVAYSWDEVAGLGWVPATMISMTNGDLAGPILVTSLAGFAATAVGLFAWFLRKPYLEGPAEAA